MCYLLIIGCFVKCIWILQINFRSAGVGHLKQPGNLNATVERYWEISMMHWQFQFHVELPWTSWVFTYGLQIYFHIQQSCSFIFGVHLGQRPCCRPSNATTFTNQFRILCSLHQGIVSFQANVVQDFLVGHRWHRETQHGPWVKLRTNELLRSRKLDSWTNCSGQKNGHSFEEFHYFITPGILVGLLEDVLPGKWSKIVLILA